MSDPRLEFTTFTGETPAEAFKKAKDMYGDRANIITTKLIRKKTISSPALYELVVAIEKQTQQAQQENHKIEPSPVYEKPKITNRTEQKQLDAYMSNTLSEDVMLSISAAAKQAQEIANLNPPLSDSIQSDRHLQSMSHYESMLQDILKKIDVLGDRVNQVSHMIWEEGSEKRNNLAIPPEFSQIYKIALESGMSRSHLDSIMLETLSNMPQKMKNNTEIVKKFFQTLLRKMIPIRKEKHLNLERQQVLMVVGPTGVGKTTTLAKLAAKRIFKDNIKCKVGAINLDNYRIGATEQLSRYAAMLKMPIENASEEGEFESVLSRFTDRNIIYIDTAGSSQYDTQKIAMLGEFLRRCDIDIDVSLVMSAGTKLEDLRDIYKFYSDILHIDTFIFTKFDETKHFGNIFSLVKETGKPISYFSIGQEVPDDIKEASSEYLINCMLDGFRRDYGTSSSK